MLSQLWWSSTVALAENIPVIYSLDILPESPTGGWAEADFYRLYSIISKELWHCIGPRKQPSGGNARSGNDAGCSDLDGPWILLEQVILTRRIFPSLLEVFIEEITSRSTCAASAVDIALERFIGLLSSYD
jgi:hypothetical protein